MNDQQYFSVPEFHLSSMGHFPVICKTGEVCDTHKEYLQSEHWQNVRSDFYLLHKRCVCEYCENEGKLHLHHQTYERIGKEYLSDLIPLCVSCHNFVHVFIDNYGKPPTPRERSSYWIPPTPDIIEKPIISTNKSPKNNPHKIFRKKNKSKRRQRIAFQLFGNIKRSELEDLMEANLLGKHAYMTKTPLIMKISEKWRATRNIEACKLSDALKYLPAPKVIAPIQSQPVKIQEDNGWPF